MENSKVFSKLNVHTDTWGHIKLHSLYKIMRATSCVASNITKIKCTVRLIQRIKVVNQVKMF